MLGLDLDHSLNQYRLDARLSRPHSGNAFREAEGSVRHFDPKSQTLTFRSF